jgi:hypothetical protein
LSAAFSLFAEPSRIERVRTVAKAAKKKPKPATAPPAAPIVAPSLYAKGDQVQHPQFGKGTVSGVDAGKLTIAFESVGTKVVLESYLKRA